MKDPLENCRSKKIANLMKIKIPLSEEKSNKKKWLHHEAVAESVHTIVVVGQP